MKHSFYSHGKLLLSGEYAVLDGATALAVPTRLGQWLHVEASGTDGMEWESQNPDGSAWFKTRFQEDDFTHPEPLTTFPTGIRERLLYMLRAAVTLNPEFAKRLIGHPRGNTTGVSQGMGPGVFFHPDFKSGIVGRNRPL